MTTTATAPATETGANRVGSPPALPGANHRGRVWEPSQGSHHNRLEVVDWLRGLAVVFMILAHGMDAWLLPAAKSGAAYAAIRIASGIPARLFLLLVGVSAAIQFESGLAKGLSTPTMRARLFRRGLLVLVLAYVFRLQEWVLSRFYGGLEALFRIDILNAIGACMLVVALVSTPRDGRRQILPSLLWASIFLGLGTVIGPAQFPAWLPRPLTSYIGGQRPMAWFSLFPWGAWAMAGVALGHLWVDASREPGRFARCFRLTFVAGAALTAAVVVLRHALPGVLGYPNEVVRQMGPGIFFSRLGLIGMFAGAGFVWCRFWRGRFSILRQFGRTSLLVYWVHIELCYGSVVYALRGRCGIPTALLLVALLTFAMLGLSLAKTRLLPPAALWLRSRLRTARAM
jgi:uncharacterized membrane protein